MNVLRKISFHIAVCILAAHFACAGSAHAWETITWPFFDWPPYYCIEDGRESGPGFVIQETLRAQLPQFQHARLDSMPRRTMMLAQHGETVCFTGAFKTRDRERFLVYSTTPCRLSEPIVIVNLAEAVPVFGPAPVSLRQVLRDNKLALGRVAGFKYGLELDSILEEGAMASNLRPCHASAPTKVLLLQLMQKEIDYILETQSQALYHAKKIGLADRLVFFANPGGRSLPLRVCGLHGQ